MHAFITPTPPDIKPSPNILTITPEKSIGIEEVRDIQYFFSRKSTSGGHIVIIHDAHLLTIPAQNALLKTLEEPPSNSKIYLVTTSPDQLLPTVLSRCQVEAALFTALSADLSYIDSFLKQKTATDKLKWLDAQEFDRSKALQFLADLEQYLHHQIKSNSQINLNYLRIAEARKYLNANCNVKLTMDILALSE